MRNNGYFLRDGVKRILPSQGSSPLDFIPKTNIPALSCRDICFGALEGTTPQLSVCVAPPRIQCSDQNAENNSPNCFLYAFYPLRVRVPLISYQKQISPHFRAGIFVFGALEGTRTPDLLVRSQSLYPAELQAHIRFCRFNSAYI